MRPDDIRAWLQHQPFRHFRIHLTNGPSFDIRHPDQVTVGRSSIIIGVPTTSEAVEEYLKRDIMVALIHITYLEPITTTGTPSVN